MTACSSASDKRKAERDVMHQETMADLRQRIDFAKKNGLSAGRLT